ncbi:MAG: hypothetical protein JOZ54_04170 [Acidobacteria bacterium]|nr:hypothetical protein [Acidobacteriota bacterium]
MTIRTSANLKSAIARAYETFARYESVSLRPVETRSEDRKKLDGLRDSLIGRELRSLPAEELLDYYYLAIRHIGDADDLRHFLPRLLELMIVDENDLLAPQVLSSLLIEADVANWPLPEKEAIVTLLTVARAEGLLSAKNLNGVLQDLTKY